MSRRDRGTSRDRTLDAALVDASSDRDRRRRERRATQDEMADRIVAEYGVDRARADAGADLYMRQLRRNRARAGY